MIEYTVYDSLTGAPLRKGAAISEATALAQGNKPGTKVVLTGSDPKTETINPATGAVQQRLPMRNAAGQMTAKDKVSIQANGVDAVTITNVPVGAICQVFLPANMNLVQPADTIVNDGTVIVTTTVAGNYQINIKYQAYLDFGVTFNAY